MSHSMKKSLVDTLAARIVSAQLVRVDEQLRQMALPSDSSSWPTCQELNWARAQAALPANAAAIAGCIAEGSRLWTMAEGEPRSVYRDYLEQRARDEFHWAFMLNGNPDFAGVGFDAREFIPRA
jgi:hypothetical protein